MLSRHCGSNVGAHFTASASRCIFASSRNISSCAESSFLPPCRAISTVNVRPRWLNTLSRIARLARTWYGRSR